MARRILFSTQRTGWLAGLTAGLNDSNRNISINPDYVKRHRVADGPRVSIGTGMGNLKYHVAVTVDGFIASHNGSFDCFPEHGDHVADYLDALESYGTVLMGRKTYEVGLKAGVTDPYPHMKSYVFSRTLKKSPNERVEIVAGNPTAFVRKLKEETGKDIYMCGGGNLAAQLFRQGLIDELILKVNPVVLGWGIPLVASLGKHVELDLYDTKVYRSGVVRLSYRVKR